MAGDGNSGNSGNGVGEKKLPRHIAVIMDGSGRWAQRSGLPRLEGHRRGLEAARMLVENCLREGVAHLTLFAFSRENWQRPEEEVAGLMRLFAEMEKWQPTLREAGVRLLFIGERERFSPALRALMSSMEKATAGGGKITVLVAAGYGGQWDIVRAARRLCESGEEFSEENLAARLATGGLPPPDLLIRSGGEKRISNFMLWQLSYAELHFTDVLWPDFGEDDLRRAIADYGSRERRYGRTATDGSAGGTVGGTVAEGDGSAEVSATDGGGR